MISILVALILFGAAFLVRTGVYQERPRPRPNPGEDAATAHVMLLGTYRVYTWLVWANFAFALFTVGVRGALPIWVAIPFGLSALGLLLSAKALYTRLGYEKWRFVMVLGHLSLAFGVSELIYGLKSDIAAYMQQYQASQTPEGT